MRIFNLALKDITQVLRDKKSLLFLVLMPIIFTFFMGFAFKDAAATPDPRLPLGWLNQDPDGSLSQQLYDMLADSDGLRLVEVTTTQPEELSRLMDSGELAAVLVVPPDFSNQALAGSPPQLSLLADELSAAGQSVFELVRVPVTRLMSSLQIARLNVASLEAQQALPASAAFQELQTGLALASQAWVQQAGSGKGPTLEKAPGESQPTQPLGGNPYNQTSPGILVMFVIFGMMTSANILVQERRTRTLQRLMTTSLKPWEIIAGHLLAMFLVVFVQQLLLVFFGQIALHVDYLRQPLGTLLMMVGMGLWIASLGLLFSVFARGEEQVVLFSMIAMFLLSALGGAWFPLETSGRTFALIGHFTPGAWAMDGFQNILIRGLGFTSILLPAGILLAYSLVFFSLAAWRFRSAQMD